MKKNIIAQFLLEKGIEKKELSFQDEYEYQKHKYKEYQLGKEKIEEDELQRWLEEKEQNNKEFMMFLARNNFLFLGSRVTEITSDPSLSCMKGINGLRKNVIICPAGQGFTSGYEKQLRTGLLIINGAYLNQQMYMCIPSRNNVFVAGYVESSNYRYNLHLLNYYKRLLLMFRDLTSTYSPILEPKVELIETEKIHVLVRGNSLEQEKAIAQHVHSYKYDDDYICRSDR